MGVAFGEGPDSQDTPPLHGGHPRPDMGFTGFHWGTTAAAERTLQGRFWALENQGNWFCLLEFWGSAEGSP